MKKHIFASYIMENTVNDLRVYDIMTFIGVPAKAMPLGGEEEQRSE